MKMKNKLNLFSVGLPSNEDLNNWSKDLIRQRLETTAITSDLIPFVSENSNYELNENMVALYDFHQRMRDSETKRLVVLDGC